MFSSSGWWFLEAFAKPEQSQSPAGESWKNPNLWGKTWATFSPPVFVITSTMVTMEKPNLSRRSLMVSPPLPIKSPTSAIFSRWGPADFEKGRFPNNQLEQFHLAGTAFFRFHLSQQKEGTNVTWNVKYWLVKNVIRILACFKPSIDLGSTIPPLQSKQPACFLSMLMLDVKGFGSIFLGPCLNTGKPVEIVKLNNGFHS